MKPLWVITFLCLSQLCQATPRLNPKPQPHPQHDDGYAYADEIDDAAQDIVQSIESATVLTTLPKMDSEVQAPISDPFEFAKKENLPALLLALRKTDFNHLSKPGDYPNNKKALNKKEQQLLNEFLEILATVENQRGYFESNLKNEFTKAAHSFAEQLEQVVIVPQRVSNGSVYRVAAQPDNTQKFTEAKKILATAFVELFLIRPEPQAPLPYKPSRLDDAIAKPSMITNGIIYTVISSILLVDTFANLALANSIIEHTVGYISDWRVNAIAQAGLGTGLVLAEPVVLIASLFKLSDTLAARAKKRRMHEALAAFRSTLVDRGIPIPHDAEELENDPLKLFSWLNHYLEQKRLAAKCEGLLLGG